MVISIGEKQNISTLSQIKILEKHHSSDWYNYWVICTDPNNPQHEENNEFKMNVKDKMVWNLLQTGTTYTAEYEKTGNEDFHLTQIMYVDDSPKLLNKEN